MIYATDKKQCGIFLTETECDNFFGATNSIEKIVGDIAEIEKAVKGLAKKFYATNTNQVKAIFLDWPTCQKYVNGVSGAQYKSFASLSDELNFIDGDTYIKQEVKTVTDNTVPYAFVDGSYNIENGVYGYGGVLVANGNVYEFYDRGNDKEAATMRNVAGEILGAQRAIEEAIALNLKEIVIYYDYQGIECWANGTWKRNKKHTQAYYEFIQEARKKIKISFQKVRAHTGVELNEKVDRLAKLAVGIH